METDQRSHAERNRRALLSGLILSSLLLGTVPAAGWVELESAALHRVTEDVRVLTSEEFEGRGPGTEGIDKAAEYIRDAFQQAGLASPAEDGSYFQSFEVPMGHLVVPDQTKLVLQGPDDMRIELELESDFRPLYTGSIEPVSGPVVFVGYGISAPDFGYDDYRDLDVEGKIVLMIRREPQQGIETGPFQGEKPTPHSYFNTKLDQAVERKAAAVLFVNDPHTVRRTESDTFVPGQGLGLKQVKLPFAQLQLDVADRLLATSPITGPEGDLLRTVTEIEGRIDRDLKPLSSELEGWTGEIEFGFARQRAETVNVIGVLEGEGPKAHETIIVGAHYDHLGFGGVGSRKPDVSAIHPGADDNASGTAAVMELARRLSTGETPPARRIVFVGFSGEERGLIGSRHYVANPIFPLEETIAMLNFDMVGNLREQELHVQGVGSGTGLEAMADTAAEDSPLAIKKSQGVMGASDHFSFYQKEIPVTFFFTGLTDLYHTPDDTFESLNLPGLIQVIDYAEGYLRELAAAEDRPQFQSISSASRGRSRMAYLGVVPDYAATAGGMQVQDVKMGSPADAGGLKPEDRIVRIGEVTISGIEDLAEGLRKYKAGETVEVAVKREDLEITLLVTLAEPGGN
jgi:hypothetical protein